MSVPKVIPYVVEQGLCTGCGLCVSQCSSKSMEMHWNEDGFLVPRQIGECHEGCNCIRVCPFNPFPADDVKTEDEIAQLFLPQAKKFNPKIGKFENLYVGYADHYRDTSSSGGLATYIFAKLFDEHIADAIMVVGEADGFYTYQVIRQSDLMRSSKTKYYPVTLADIFSQIDTIGGKVAVVGVACFMKAIRLAQHADPALKEKIPFLVGIICGGLKSRFFSDYLAGRSGFAADAYQDPQYRIKDDQSTASDYSFGATANDGSGASGQIKMKAVGDMWGTGMFKANACDFCEDVATELADISLGDAWIKPYSADGKGTSVVVTRTDLAESIIQQGLANNELSLEPLSEDKMIQSQQGSFNHRHAGLKYRIKKRKQKGLLVPPKRTRNLMAINYFFARVQDARMKTREESLKQWRLLRSSTLFDRTMVPTLIQLKDKTKRYHFFRGLKRKLGL